MNDDLRTRGRKTITEMFSIVDDVTVDDLKTKGITLRSGNKVLKFEVVAEDTLSIEDEIREEVRVKLAEKMAEVKKNLNKRIEDMMKMTKQVKEEAEKKNRQLKEKLASTEPMPDVTFDLAKQGLSVAKGGRNELIWLVRGVYWPKYVVDDNDQYRTIETRYAKKMMSDVLFMIRTEGKNVKEVSTRKPIGLAKFDHYHQRTGVGSTDCWGKWKFDKRWSTPRDILRIAKEAESVLETVNFLSIANPNPAHLPRKDNLEDHLTNEPVDPGRVDTRAARLGINNRNVNNLNNDVWTA